MTPTQRKAMRDALEALRQTSEYLLIEVNEARARDANINTIYDWEDKLSKHHEAISALIAALAEPAPVPLLTDAEISDIAIANPPNVHTYGRAIEKAVRQKAGL